MTATRDKAAKGSAGSTNFNFVIGGRRSLKTGSTYPSITTQFFVPMDAKPKPISPAVQKGLDQMKADFATAKAAMAAKGEKVGFGDWIIDRMQTTMTTLAHDPTAVNGPLTNWIPRALFLLLPLFAGLLALFHWRQRKEFYFVDHLVFSLNIHSFAFVVLIAAVWLAQVLTGGTVGWLALVAVGAYLLLAMKRFYGQGWFWTVTQIRVRILHLRNLLPHPRAGARHHASARSRREARSIFRSSFMADAFDVIVIGSGPAGYVCAIRAAQLGLKAAIVERAELGGICLNWGCIPTKALLRSSEILHLMHRLDEFGFSADNLKFDLAKIVARSRAVSKQLSNGVAFLMKKHKITVITGEAKLAGQGKVSVTKDGKATDYAAKNIVLATGARARTLPGLEPDGKLIWTYREALVPDVLPKKLLVVGSGAIGIEFASFFHTLGAEVTVVEVLDRVLPVEDEEISKLADKAFKKQGMTIKHRDHGREAGEGRGQRHRHAEGEGRQDGNPHRRSRDPGSGHCRQCREYRPRTGRREGRPHPCRRQPMGRDGRAGHLGHRRSGRPALARAQGHA